MSSADQIPQVCYAYRFGAFEARVDEQVLLHRGKRMKIQGLPFRMLLVLLEHPGELVSKEVLRDRLWGQETFVEVDKGLYVLAAKLREALGDDATVPRFVKTVSGKGYQFVAKVDPVFDSTQTPAPEQVVVYSETKPEPSQDAVRPSWPRNAGRLSALFRSESGPGFRLDANASARTSCRLLRDQARAIARCGSSLLAKECWATVCATRVLGGRGLVRLPDSQTLCRTFGWGKESDRSRRIYQCDGKSGLGERPVVGFQVKASRISLPESHSRLAVSQPHQRSGFRIAPGSSSRLCHARRTGTPQRPAERPAAGLPGLAAGMEMPGRQAAGHRNRRREFAIVALVCA